jgi:DNA invertase Pin-like site-specific DNA recombinase
MRTARSFLINTSIFTNLTNGAGADSCPLVSLLQQIAAVADLEAGLIGNRTCKALAAATAQEEKRGGPQPRRALPHGMNSCVRDCYA